MLARPVQLHKTQFKYVTKENSMYKIKNPYKEPYMLDLNLMEIRSSRRIRFSGMEATVMMAPIVIAGVYALATMFPDLGFFAECQNIPGGDVCTISIK